MKEELWGVAGEIDAIRGGKIKWRVAGTRDQV